MAIREHHCCAEYLFLKKRALLTPTKGRLAWPKTRTVPASNRPKAMSIISLLRQRQQAQGSCCSTARRSTHRSTRFFHSGWSLTCRGASESDGIAAMPRPTSRERDVCTKMKLPWMKRSWGARSCWAQVTSKGFVASKKMKQNTRTPRECKETRLRTGAMVGGPAARVWGAASRSESGREAAASALRGRCRLWAWRTRNSSEHERENDMGAGSVCIFLLRLMPLSPGCGLEGFLRLRCCSRLFGFGMVAKSSTETNTNKAESVTGQKCLTPDTSKEGRK
mmetsp:Transcript_5588/g.17175  ORF Transcript_5588/g.17175 Transcript_5588/m.17175 type:complete len:279 (+) Transcript_5588:853-1689(+)